MSGADPDDITTALRAFADRIESEAPASGPFKPIRQSLPVAQFVLELSGTQTERHLELRLEAAGGESRTEVLQRGTNPQVLAFLRAPGAAELVTLWTRKLVKAAPPPKSRMARTRTSAEMRFFVSLQSCPHCQRRIDDDRLKIYGQAEMWSLTGKCASCGQPLEFHFTTYGNPIETSSEHLELGRGHSEIIAPYQLIAEVERLAPTLQHDPTTLSVAAWKANRDANNRVRTCLNELAKFIPDGADSIPDALLSYDDRLLRGPKPDRFTRTWIEEMGARHARLTAANTADLPRIDSLESSRKRPKGISYLDRDALLAHEAWVARGKKGKGRLVLVDAAHARTNIGNAIEMSGAMLDDVDFSETKLVAVKLAGAELRDVRFTGARVDGANLHGTTIAGGSFADANLSTAELKDARIDSTDLSRAELDCSAWAGASIKNARFVGAQFGNATLDDAVFERCDFRDADFAPRDRHPDPTTRGTRFVECDLRNTNWAGRDLSKAAFVRCKLAGTKGPPDRTDGVVIEAPDLSADGDGSNIGNAGDVFELWMVEVN